MFCLSDGDSHTSQGIVVFRYLLLIKRMEMKRVHKPGLSLPSN